MIYIVYKYIIYAEIGVDFAKLCDLRRIEWSVYFNWIFPCVFRFVKMLHSLKTPNFSTLICYDRVSCGSVFLPIVLDFFCSKPICVSYI